MRGKVNMIDFNTFRTLDHPRLCGEKVSFKNFSNTDLGSPPPMRGKGIFNGSFANVGVGENDAVSGRIKCVQHSEKFS